MQTCKYVSVYETRCPSSIVLLSSLKNSAIQFHLFELHAIVFCSHRDSLNVYPSNAAFAALVNKQTKYINAHRCVIVMHAVCIASYTYVCFRLMNWMRLTWCSQQFVWLWLLWISHREKCVFISFFCICVEKKIHSLWGWHRNSHIYIHVMLVKLSVYVCVVFFLFHYFLTNTFDLLLPQCIEFYIYTKHRVKSVLSRYHFIYVYM